KIRNEAIQALRVAIRNRHQQLAVAITIFSAGQKRSRSRRILRQQLAIHTVESPGLHAIHIAFEAPAVGIVGVGLPLIVCPRLLHAVLGVVGALALTGVVVIGLVAGIVITIVIAGRCDQPIVARVRSVIGMRHVRGGLALIDGAIAPAIVAVSLREYRDQ